MVDKSFCERKAQYTNSYIFNMKKSFTQIIYPLQTESGYILTLYHTHIMIQEVEIIKNTEIHAEYWNHIQSVPS
jgi:hypothetical protein